MYVNKILIIPCKFVVFVMLFPLLSACVAILPEPYKIPIEQGNALTQEEYESIYTGMTKQEVLDALGPPVMQHTFSPDRWDYLYRLVPSEGKTRNSRLTLHFEGDTLVKIDDQNFREY